jgi:alpha-beta hydrolase superfamily lysophospholipase
MRHQIELHVLTTGPNGPDTPATFGAPFDHTSIPRGPRQLDASVVTAPTSCTNAPILLIYHGMGETLSDWARAQQFLYTQCVSSVVFDPTGAGNSPRPARIRFTLQDAVAAYQFTTKLFAGRPVYVLGHSLGNAFLLAAVPHFSPSPAGVIEANGFSALRSVAGHGKSTAFRLFLAVMPTWWDNVSAVKHVHVPLLVLASDGDRVMPVENGLAIFAAADQPRHFVLLHGFGHNALYQHPALDWWAQPLAFLRQPPST